MCCGCDGVPERWFGNIWSETSVRGKSAFDWQMYATMPCVKDKMWRVSVMIVGPAQNTIHQVTKLEINIKDRRPAATYDH